MKSKRRMSRAVFCASSAGLLLVVGASAASLHGSAPVGPLTPDQMSQLVGAQCPGCELSDPLTDCQGPDEDCASCASSTNEVNYSCDSDFKDYAEAEREVCVPDAPANDTFCDEGMIRCWTEKQCITSPPYTERRCSGGSPSTCVSEDEADTWNCTHCSEGEPTGNYSQKSDDTCVPCDGGSS